MVTATSSWPRLGLALSFLISFASASAPVSLLVANEEAYRTLSLALSLSGSSILAFCVARRTRGLRHGATPSRRLLFAILIDSWAFIFFSAIMTSGIGLSFNSAMCRGALVLCTVCYGSGKALIYTFLAERVYTVHARGNRLRYTAYRMCLVFLLGFGVILALMIWGRIAFIRDGTTHSFPFTEHVMDGSDYACVIGVNRPASISLLVVDLFLGVLFTCLFLYPLYRSRSLTPPLRQLAKRTLWATLVALVTSAANVTVSMILHNQEFGWFCLSACTADVTINALALLFVTGSHGAPQPPKRIDPVTAPVIRRRSAMPIRQTLSLHQRAASHPSVHFLNTEQRAPGALETGASQALRSIVGLPPGEGPPSQQSAATWRASASY